MFDLAAVEKNFSPQLRDKIWEWPGDKARLSPQKRGRGGGGSLGTRLLKITYANTCQLYLPRDFVQLSSFVRVLKSYFTKIKLVMTIDT